VSIVSLGAKFVTAAALGISLAGANAYAQRTEALDCPGSPTEVNRDIKNSFEAGVGRILGLRAAELKNETTIVARQLLAQVPNADRVYVAQMMTSVFCQQLSRSGLSNAEKLDRIGDFTNRIALMVSAQVQTDSPTTRGANGGESAPARLPKLDGVRRSPAAPIRSADTEGGVSTSLGAALLGCEERAQRHAKETQSLLDSLIDEKKKLIAKQDESAKERSKLSSELSSCQAMSTIALQSITQEKLSREWSQPPPKTYVDWQTLIPDCVGKYAAAFKSLKFENVSQTENSVTGIQGPYNLYMLCFEPRQMLIVSGPDLDVARKITAMVRGER
jgi:hypothetical protein